MDIQIPIGSPDDTYLEELGVIISAGSSMSDIYLTVDRTGRQNFMNRDLKIQCTALTTTPVFMINEGCEYFIRTFGTRICVFVTIAYRVYSLNCALSKQSL